jgi:transposase
VRGRADPGLFGQERPPPFEPTRQPRRQSRALYVIALCRMSREERTRSYVAKRTAEGKTKKEIIRCLKRYIAREVYRILTSAYLNKPPILAP